MIPIGSWHVQMLRVWTRCLPLQFCAGTTPGSCSHNLTVALSLPAQHGETPQNSSACTAWLIVAVKAASCHCKPRTRGKPCEPVTASRMRRLAHESHGPLLETALNGGETETHKVQVKSKCLATNVHAEWTETSSDHEAWEASLMAAQVRGGERTRGGLPTRRHALDPSQKLTS